ncbi:MAG TPA: NUDIX domain-containing protein [Streptomyces sp.]|uniref:NUDIX domain-containing protein n=1 Tax=Streptomyces sp. TaxID=1931 RepID=UPI002BE4125C|nr:NUDIX domain-containing protein [Streptomyces sp.]HWU09644.1 NUDIX domain-containing protein [Streptomyces sp.]
MAVEAARCGRCPRRPGRTGPGPYVPLPHRGPSLEFPRGGCEPGEDPREAAARELEEETAR